MMFSKTLSFVVAAIVAAVVLVGSANPVQAQPPGTAVYEYRPDLGGWLDTARGVVWGYSMSDSTGYSFTRNGAISSAAAYPDLLFSQADLLLSEAQHAQQQADFYAVTDPPRSQAYADLAAQYEADAAAFEDAATAADQFSNWRLPTLAEFQAASQAGLFTRGANGFNLDMSPAVGYQAGYGGDNWTSQPTKKVKGKDTGLLFDIDDGGSTWMTTGTPARALIIRTYLP
jgi:hypothetical protein